MASTQPGTAMAVRKRTRTTGCSLKPMTKKEGVSASKGCLATVTLDKHVGLHDAGSAGEKTALLDVR